MHASGTFPIELGYEIDRMDLIRAYRAYGRANPSRLDLFFAGILILLAVLQFYYLGPHWLSLLPLIFGIAVLFRPFLLITPLILYRRYRALYGTPVKVTITDEAIRAQTGPQDAKRDWTGYRQIIETDELFLFVWAKLAFFAIPKRAFRSSSHQDALRELAKSRIKQFIDLRTKER